MYIDPQKLRSARERRAMTQEALAHQARVNVRTVQRAECGSPIRAETLADLAAVLGLPPAGLLSVGPHKEQEVVTAEADEGQTSVLKRVDSGELIVSTLERCTMSALECSAEPTPEALPVLREVIGQMETLMKSPWEFGDSSPLRFGSLIGRLEAVAALNRALADLERNGLAVFMGVTTEYAKVPVGQEEGYMVTWAGQRPQYIRAARFLIAQYTAERLRVSSDVLWPLPLELDDEPPF